MRFTVRLKTKAAKVTTKLSQQVAATASKHIDDNQAVEMARARLKAAKLRMMSRPMREDGEPLDPVLPMNITEISGEELGNLFGEFAIMSQYAVQIVAISSVERAARARIDKYTRAVVHLQKSGTIADKAAKVEVDARVRTTGFDLLKGDSTTALTESMLNSFVIGRDCCSREMSRRQSEAGRSL